MTSDPLRILVIEDDSTTRELLRELLGMQGMEVLTAVDGGSGLRMARETHVHAVVLDLGLPDMTGIEVLRVLKEMDARLPVVILTGRSDIPTAKQTTELGAFAFLIKSMDLQELAIVLRRALELRSLGCEVEALRRRLVDGGELERLMGQGESIRRVIEQVCQVAPSDLTVLLQGETGAGKEVVSRAIHRHSGRAAKPFVAVDCGAIPEALIESELFGHERGAFTGAQQRQVGQFQLAQGGTLFLDEVGNLPLALQGKLLRILQERRVQPIGAREAISLDVRFVVATNVDLQQEVAAGRFRQDLYFRMAEYTIRIPPLRSRLEDLEHLAQRFVDEARSEMRRPVRGLDPAALELLRAHEWPGNVRELRNVIRQAVLRCDGAWVEATHVRTALSCAEPDWALARAPLPSALDIGARALTEALAEGRSLRQIAVAALESAERAAIVAMLEVTSGNKSEAARRLRTDYKTLHVKISRYGLRDPPSA